MLRICPFLLAFILTTCGPALPASAETPAKEKTPEEGEVVVPFHGGSNVRFLTKSAAGEHLQKPDFFIERLSPFDLQVRLRREGEITRQELLEFVSRQTLDWKAEEVKKISAVLSGIREKMHDLAPLFPDEVWLIKTTGKDESNAAYCRSPAVILPQRMVDGSVRSLERLLVHELFHILSRRDAARREKMYQIVGFQICGPIKIPAWLEVRRITNPDAPLLNCYAELTIDDKPTKITPVLYSKKQNYDAARGGSLFQYLVFRLAEVEKDTDTTWRLVEQNGEPVFHDPQTTADYFAKIGRNTGYIIHPEEVLAENFVFLVLGAEALKSPQIPQKLGVILGRKE